MDALGTMAARLNIDIEMPVNDRVETLFSTLSVISRHEKFFANATLATVHCAYTYPRHLCP